MNTYEPFSAHQIPLVALPDAGKGLGSLLPMHSGYECLGWSPRDDKLTKKAPPKKAKATSFHIINKKAETYLTQKFIFAFLRAPVRQRARRFCWCLSTLQIHWSTGGDCAWVLKPGADNIWQHVSDFSTILQYTAIQCVCIYTYIYIYTVYTCTLYIYTYTYVLQLLFTAILIYLPEAPKMRMWRELQTCRTNVMERRKDLATRKPGYPESYFSRFLLQNLILW